MAIRYPAIFIGGPPHSGKSWLTWHLAQALRAAGVAGYVLRAHPDGEGNWRYETPPVLADELRRRVKHSWSATFAQQVSRDIERRTMPLLVDAGGKLSPENNQILTSCTGVILIAAEPADLAPWRDEVQRLNLPLLADLVSIRAGEPQLDDAGVIIRGRIGGLGPGGTEQGPCFEALVERLASLFAFDSDELYRHHSALIEREPLHLGRSIAGLPAHSSAGPLWRPDELPQLLAAIDRDEPLALYGVAPTWVYGALALHIRHDPLLFNVALGWVAPPPVAVGAPLDVERLRWEVTPIAGGVLVRLTLAGPYLDYDESLAAPLPIPVIPVGQGVAIDGKLPIWLVVAIARAYTAASWVGLREPRSDPPQAVIIAAQASGLVGTLRPISIHTDPKTPQ